MTRQYKLLEGCGLHVEDTGGDGHAVVLIHGWPLSGEMWKAQLDALQTAGFRAIAFDRRGFGHSHKPDSGYDYDVLADDVAELTEEMGLDNFTLVGFSMGGGEAARYPTRHGESKLKSLVFASAVPPCFMKSEDNPDGLLPAADFEDMRQSVTEDPSGFFEQFTKAFFSADGELKTSEAERQNALTLCQQANKIAVVQTMDAWAKTDFRPDLKKITRPVLVIHGDSDRIVPFEYSGKRIAEQVADAEVCIIKGGSHGINTTHANEFNNALIDFLSRH